MSSPSSPTVSVADSHKRDNGREPLTNPNHSSSHRAFEPISLLVVVSEIRSRCTQSGCETCLASALFMRSGMMGTPQRTAKAGALHHRLFSAEVSVLGGSAPVPSCKIGFPGIA